MDWEEYIREELKYYDEHPEELAYVRNVLAHSNSFELVELDYTTSS